MAIRVRPDRYAFQMGIDTRQLFASSQMLTDVTGQAVQSNKAIVGRNAFAHEAGIHQDGILKDRRTYEIMRPEDVGVPATTLVLGKHSGRHAVQKRCDEMGFTLSRLEIDRVYRQMVALADAHKAVSDVQLRGIVDRVKHGDRLAAASPGATRATGGSDAAALADPAVVPTEVGYGHGV